MIEFDKKRTSGISCEPWEDLLKKYFKLMNLPFDHLNRMDIIDLYHEDMTVKEAYYHLRLSTLISAEVIVSWKDAFGFEQIHFYNNVSIRRFYKQNPSVKKFMD